MEGEGRVRFRADRLPLQKGSYALSAFAFDTESNRPYDYHDRLYDLRVSRAGRDEGLVHIEHVVDFEDG